MNKGIELTPSQIKAYENGATNFLLPISMEQIRMSQCGNSNILDFAPIQKGDKDIFIKEDFEEEFSGHIVYKSNVSPDEDGLIYFKDEFGDFIPYEYLDYFWEKAKNMTKEQSRYSFSECIDIEVIRVQEIETNANILRPLGINWHTPKSYYGRCINMKVALREFYNKQMQEQNINRTYEDNDYVF